LRNFSNIDKKLVFTADNAQQYKKLLLKIKKDNLILNKISNYELNYFDKNFFINSIACYKEIYG
jgi:hypothetical protein